MQDTSISTDNRLWNADYLKVLTTNFTSAFAFYLVTPLLPIYLSETFSAAKDVIGFALSGYAVTAILSRPIAGWMVDSLPRKRVLLMCIFLNFILFVGYLIPGTLFFFIVVRTIHGAPFGAFTVANNTAVIDVLPLSRRSEGIGFYGLSNNIAMAVAPMVGVYVYSSMHDFNILFLIAMISAAIGWIVGSSIHMHPPKMTSPKKEKVSLGNFILLNGLLIGCNMVFFGCCYGALSNYLAIYGKEVLGRTGGTGTFFLLLAIGLILSRLQGNRSLRQGNFIRHATQGVVLSSIGYTLFVACPGDIGYFGSALLIGLGNGHLWPAFQNMIIGVAHNNEHGTATSTILSSWSLGIGIGIFLGGVLAEHIGYTSMFWTVALIHLCGAALLVCVTRGYYHRRMIHQCSNTHEDTRM
ncbi:MAG: MFS transporter [Desulfovibrio sp.]|nr:MFS transporter [Desulfovibrio sp.]